MYDDYSPYAHYVIRDQDDGPRTLDLLQGWGPPLREPLRMRLCAALSLLGRKLMEPRVSAPCASPTRDAS